MLHKDQKGFGLILIVFIIGLILVGIAGYLIFTKHINPPNNYLPQQINSYKESTTSGTLGTPVVTSPKAASLESAIQAPKPSFIYADDQFNVQLELPSNWLARNFVDENNVYHAVLSSQDKNIEIDMVYGSIDSLDDPHSSKVSLGEYQALKSSYEAEQGSSDFIILGVSNSKKPLVLYTRVTNDTEANIALLNNILKSFKFTEAQQGIDGHIKYNLPQDWIFSTENTSSTSIIISSKDFNPDEYHQTKGIFITIDKSVSSGKTVERELNNLPGVIANSYKPISIDNVQGGCINNSGLDQYLQKCVVIKGDTLWTFFVFTPNSDVEKTYKPVIDAFFNSIKLN